MTSRLRAAIVFAALGLAAAAPASAQVLGASRTAWATPGGDLSDNFIGNDSWVGVSMEVRRLLNPNASVGLSVGYTAFYENTTDPLFLPGGTVSGEQYRSMNMFPILATGHLYSKAGGKIQTYIGLGIGAYVMKQRMDVADTEVKTSNVVVGFAPELGFILNKGNRNEIAIFGRYNYPANAGTYIGGESGSYQYLSVGVSLLRHQ